MYVCIFILRICARRRRCLRGFRWYISVFCNSGVVSGIRGKQMTPAVASERSIFSKNHDYNTYIKSFPCRGEHVRTYISGHRCTRWHTPHWTQSTVSLIALSYLSIHILDHFGSVFIRVVLHYFCSRQRGLYILFRCFLLPW